MTISKLRVTCKKCKAVSEVDVITNAPISVCVASMNAARCPSCGSDKLGLGGAHSGAPPLSKSIIDRAAWWFERGETGISSLTIYVAMAGGYRADHDCNWPCDPSDFRRCKQLLDLIPEWRADLSKVTARFPWFKPFEDNWGEFERLYAQEHKFDVAPRLYKEMKRVEEQARAIQSKKKVAQ